MSDHADTMHPQEIVEDGIHRPYLTRQDVQTRLGIGAAQLQELQDAGHLRTVPGRQYFHRAEVARYCREGAPHVTQTGVICICMVGHLCPIADDCRFAQAAEAINVGQRIEVDVVQPLGDWTAGACDAFESAGATA